MKAGWEYKKLDDICTIVGRIGFRGYTKADLVDSPNDGAITLSPSNITNGELDFSKCTYISWDKYNESPEIMLTKGDVVLVKTASIGKCAVVKELPHKATLNPQFVVLKGIIGEPNFIGYYLKSPVAQITIKQMAGGVAIPTLSQKKLGTMLIPSPPLSEQQSIVDYLDSAFAKIDAMKANAEKTLNEAKALFQASLKEMLEPKEGIKWSTIGDLFETYSGGTPTKSNKEYYEGGLIPWLRSGEVCQKEITRTEMFITEKGLKESSAKYYPENTVVVAMYGATAAQVGILRIKSTSNQAVCGILPHKDFLPEFVYYWFSSIENKLAAQAQGGAQPNISQQKIKKVEIPLYSIIKQQSIVENLDSLKSKVDKLQENYDKISQECDALKQAILRQVFE